jgi:deoxynucleoside kinase
MLNQAINFSTGQKSRYYILVEGNIAVGKSTFIDRLEEKLGRNATIFKEPVDKWTDLRGTNLLKEMYQDPPHKSFAIQTYIQLTMAMTQQSMIYRPIKVMERSLNSGRKVFTEAMKILGHISPTEYNILDEWYQWLDHRNIPTNQIIYLRSSPDLALKRLRQRNRPEESNVNLDYLTLIHDLHENWLIHHKPRNLPPVKVIDQDQTLEETLCAADQLAIELKSKIFPHLLC